MIPQHDLERMARWIDAWDPAEGDLPDELALAMDESEELRARFDARFARWESGVEPEAPADLARRVLPPAANRPFRRLVWLVPSVVAASVLLAAGVATLTVGTTLRATSHESAIQLPVSSTTPAEPEVATVVVDGTREEMRKTLEQLKAMGYIEGGDEIVDAPAGDVTLPLDGHLRWRGRNEEGELRGEPPPTTGNGFVDPGMNGFVDPQLDPFSTFSIDVDRGSYTFARRRLREGFLPDPAGVRTEEFVNALVYDYPQPDEGPFTVQFEASPNPWNPETQIVRIGVQGRDVAARKPVHLTFLVDTSGSMSGADRLPLVQKALKLLVGELRDGDTVALVAYAGSAGVVLPPTPATEQRRILAAIDHLQAGGSTAMGAGIDLAYRLAGQTLREGETSRVIVASDGDANVGATSPDALNELIRQQADRGVTLTTLGFGEGNYQDFRMEQLANDGDGNYFYVDSVEEARRVFVDELTSTLEVIARDVKIQVDWNPDAVRQYRLLGYENRGIADRDFRNDRVDAGEIGAGHTVTALYVVELAPGASDPIATVRLRAKPPGEDAAATERTFTLPRGALQPSFAEASADHRMAVATATFAERLRGSPYVVGIGWSRIASLAAESARPDHPEDQELVELVRRAAELSGR